MVSLDRLKTPRSRPPSLNLTGDREAGGVLAGRLGREGKLALCLAAVLVQQGAGRVRYLWLTVVMVVVMGLA
jgi:hypothetical protein